MVTTTDGRVLASAGAHGELEHALALDCFDRTGRLLTETEPVGIRPPARPRRPPGRRADRRRASLDHGLLVAFCSHRDAHGRRRAPARAGGHRRRAGHHQGPGRLGGREQVPRRVPARRPRRPRRQPRARPSPTPARSAGTSTGPWWSWWPRPTRTTPSTTAVGGGGPLPAAAVRAGLDPRRDGARPPEPGDGLQPGGRGAVRRARPGADTDRIMRTVTTSPAWSAAMAVAGAGPSRPASRGRSTRSTEPAPGLRRGPQGGERRPADARRRRPHALRRPRDLPPAGADPRQRATCAASSRSPSASWRPTTPPRTPTCARR